VVVHNTALRDVGEILRAFGLKLVSGAASFPVSLAGNHERLLVSSGLASNVPMAERDEEDASKMTCVLFPFISLNFTEWT